jgi:hypothetical protein
MVELNPDLVRTWSRALPLDIDMAYLPVDLSKVLEFDFLSAVSLVELFE